MNSDRPDDEVSPPRIGVLPSGWYKVRWRPPSRRTVRIATAIAVLAIFGLILAWTFRAPLFSPSIIAFIGLLLGVVLPIVTAIAFGEISQSASRPCRAPLDIPDECRIAKLPA